MPKCPKCDKEVYFAERVTSLGKDWHRPCLKCEKCNKTLSAGSHAEHDGKPYCNNPCYSALFGPKDTSWDTLEHVVILSFSEVISFPQGLAVEEPKATHSSRA
ncbi:cysteine-rich protein 1 (intestinal)-like [Scleropages formosus]|uniref:Cysteine-rich protein 1 (Intestinal)-like n=1 Tax=Scleropages formosus TaxID=113540 RepID=A0A0P7UDI6_SCLFO|nr:cysteine-rich protein 1 (intestinal)-like [Scleropages formosus]